MIDTSDIEGRMVSVAPERRPQVRMGTLPQELPHSSQTPLNFAMNQRSEASCFKLMISEVGLKVMGQFASKKSEGRLRIWRPPGGRLKTGAGGALAMQ